MTIMRNRQIGILLSYTNTFLNMVCGLFLSSFLLRKLGDTDYGIYQTICSFVNYLVLLEFGTGAVITRNIARCRGRSENDAIQKNISTIWTVNLVLSVVILVASAFFYVSIDTIYAKTLTPDQMNYARRIFVFATTFLIISFLANITNGIMMGFEHYQIQPILSIVKLIVRTGLLVACITMFTHAIVIAIVDVVVSIGVLAFDVWYCTTKLHVQFTAKYFDRSIFRESLPLSLAIFIQTIVNQANSNVDKFVLGIRLSPESVAIYSVGLYIYSIFSSMTTIPISMYGPQIIKAVGRGMDGKQLENMLVQPSRLIVLIGGTVLFGFVAVGKQFIGIVYGSQYEIAWLVALIIMCPMLINMSNGVLINVLDAKNLRMSRSWVLAITTVANIILTVLWIERWGILGACIATAICTLLGQITMMNFYYVKRLHVDVLYMYRKTFSGILIPQLLAAWGAFLIAKSIDNIYVSFFAGGITYVLGFGLLSLLYKKNRLEVGSAISTLRRKWRR